MRVRRLLLFLIVAGPGCFTDSEGSRALDPDAARDLRRKLAESQAARPTDRGFTPTAPDRFTIDLFDQRESFRRNLAAAAESTGEMQLRVWNGHPSNERYVTALFGRGGGRCSGILVSPNTILTAAHCICEFRKDGVKPDGIRVAFRQNPSPEALGELIRVTQADREVVCPFGFNEADIVLLRLERSAKESPKRLADAPTMTALTKRAVVRVVGYGLTEAGRFAGRREADVIVASPTCSASDAAYFGCLEGQELVARNVNEERDACSGDSGGALLLEDPAGSGKFELVGVVSRPVLRGAVCGDGGVYGRVDDSLRQRVHAFQVARAR